MGVTSWNIHVDRVRFECFDIVTQDSTLVSGLLFSNDSLLTVFVHGQHDMLLTVDSTLFDVISVDSILIQVRPISNVALEGLPF